MPPPPPARPGSDRLVTVCCMLSPSGELCREFTEHSKGRRSDGGHLPQNDPTKLRETYDGSLAAFPLCYGYWQKFADAEARFRGAEAAQAVYERGVAAISNSIDLWMHYCQFKQSIHPPPDDVRRCTSWPVSRLTSMLFTLR